MISNESSYDQNASQPHTLQQPTSLPVFSPPIQQELNNNSSSLTVTDAARIAIYDTPGATPRVVIVEPSDIRTYIDNITLHVYNEARQLGGKISYMVIREAVENFIHAYFREPIITILDNGNTIRFTDQGPGIQNPDLVTQPGITSATKEMKSYIRGSGSGLPVIKENLQGYGGELHIHPNVGAGACITITLNPQACEKSCRINTGETEGETYSSLHSTHQSSAVHQPEYTQYTAPVVMVPQPYMTPMYPTSMTTYPQSFNHQPYSVSATPHTPLHPDAYKVLQTIKRFGQGGPTLVSDHCDISVSTAHRRIQELIDQGLLIKEKRKVVLSTAGYAALEQGLQ